MNSIETSIQDSELLWNEYYESYSNSAKIRVLEFVVTVVEMAVMPYGTALKIVTFITTFAHLAIVLMEHREGFFFNRKIQWIGYGMTLAMNLACVPFKKLALLPIFRGMCYYSSSLNLEEFTSEKSTELHIEMLKKVITSDEQTLKVPPVHSLIFDFSKVNGYFQIVFNHHPFRENKISKLLNFAYQHRKIISFFNFLGDNSDSNLDFRQFALSVDYLVECKKNNPSLDERFINTQLEYLRWNFRQFTFTPTPIPIRGHLAIVNGVPVINKGSKLGDISELKQKLVDCFGSVAEINTI